MRSNSKITIETFSDTFFQCMDDCLRYIRKDKDKDVYEFIEKLKTENQEGSELFKHVLENHLKVLNIVNILDRSETIPDHIKQELNNTIRALDKFIILNSCTKTDQNQSVKSYTQYRDDKDQRLHQRFEEQQNLNDIARALIKLRENVAFDDMNANDIARLVDFKEVYDGLDDSKKRFYEDSLTREIYKIANEDTSITEHDAYHYSNFDRELDMINLNTFFKQLNDQQDGLYQHNRREPRVSTISQAVTQPSSPISSKVGKVAMFMSFVAVAAATLLLSRSGPSIG